MYILMHIFVCSQFQDMIITQAVSERSFYYWGLITPARMTLASCSGESFPVATKNGAYKVKAYGLSTS